MQDWVFRLGPIVKLFIGKTDQYSTVTMTMKFQNLNMRDKTFR